MQKYVILILICICLVGCSNDVVKVKTLTPIDISQHLSIDISNLGNDAIDILDNYLEGDVTTSETRAALDKIYDALEQYKPSDDKSIECSSYLLIRLYIDVASGTLRNIDMESQYIEEKHTTTLDDVLTDRNNIAVLLGVDEK